MKKELFGLSLIELQELLVAAGLKKFRAAQVYQWLYQKSVTAFDQMRNLSKADIAILEANFTLLPQQLKILREQVSQDDLTRKVLLEFSDGNSVETVLMRHDYGYSVCVSSQVGCDMGCAFCASGLSGCIRNLTAAEILAQVYIFNSMLVREGKKVSRIVVMGSGEPTSGKYAVYELPEHDDFYLRYYPRYRKADAAGTADQSGNFVARSRA